MSGQYIGQLIREVREIQPLVHHITNKVVMNFSANGLLAFGGSPVMAAEEAETADMASVSQGLLLNIGTMTKPELAAMITAGRAANENGVPVVIDPVGVAATPFRSESVQKLLNEVKPTLIKGNAGEMAHLIDVPWETKGVDSTGEGDVGYLASQVAQTYHTVALVTGETDVLSDGNQTAENRHGSPMLARITGSGCLLGSVVTACLSSSSSTLDAALAGTAFYGLAAEYAAHQLYVHGPGTFTPAFLDSLALSWEELVLDGKKTRVTYL
ncbi:hydroxyethylthiazole kinase [Thalassobacillus sp. CUG 92003]|uniref:hydroxyethylthiazole kinase n=1 Tax=Thalassobacillus sp. CUG 92003 TaxID=2736641 RepID=UPI0015E6830A|nr:hydroxyethylthiazole kinase [Thalassobacillus sp. CUG 92003]